MVITKYKINWLAYLLCAFCVGCSYQDKNKLPGYIEGEYTYVSTDATGTLQQCYVIRGQQVRKGDPLFLLDPEPEKAAMEAAKANAEKAQSEVLLAKIQLSRYKSLYEKNATDHATLDQKTTDYATKVKSQLAAEKNLTEATWAYGQKSVSSPIDGMVFDTYYRAGEKVTARTPVVAILAPSNIQVLFFIPENQLSTIKVGQAITIHCDECKQQTMATIYYISPEAEYTPPIIYHQDTRYKLVYRVKAKLPPTIATQFHPGQPLDIMLHE